MLAVGFFAAHKRGILFVILSFWSTTLNDGL